MSFREKYLKYKNKYLLLKKYKYGGFIKVVENIPEEYNKETYPQFISKLDDYMPLCAFDNKKTNFILINNDNYILINKKLNEDYELYQLDNIFDIKKIDKQHEIIEDNIIIPGINKIVNDVHLIQAYNYFNEDIFRKFLSKIWITAYPYFNILRKIIYRRDKFGGIGYEKNTNIVLSMIFMNKLDYIFSILNNLDKLLLDDTNNYHEYKRRYDIRNKHKEVLINDFNDVKSELLYCYISRDDLMINDLDVDTFEKLKNMLIDKLSSIKSLKFNEQPQIDEFNLIMKIICIIYTHVNENLHLIDKYNYSLFILKYKNFNDILDDKVKTTNYKSLKTFINNYNRNIIKNKLVLNLSCLIYLCYKTNIELGINYKAPQYMLIDYFIGIGKIKNSCIPINQRQVILNILQIQDSVKLRETEITDEIEVKYYEQIKQIFKEIKQYTFNEPTKKLTDCGETTIINIFNYLLLKEDGSFNLEDADTWDIKLKEFYMKYPTMESMIKINIEDLKKDLSEVFYNRGDQIFYNKLGDINTSIENIIKTCVFLLKIKTDNFNDIFKKLNKSVKDSDIKINESDELTYLNKFNASFTLGHAEFKFFLNKTVIHKFDDSKYSLFEHWITLNNEWYNIRKTEYYPIEYSLEHFKYIFYNEGNYSIGHNFFEHKFPSNKQTEEICLEAISPSKERPSTASLWLIRSIWNFNAILNKTDKICRRFYCYLYASHSIEDGNIIDSINTIVYDLDLDEKYTIDKIPEEFLEDPDFYKMAFNMNHRIIKHIPYQYQDKLMVEKIKGLENEKESIKKRLLTFINPTLL